MLDLILGNDEKAFSLGEIYAYFRPWHERHYKSNCRCGTRDCPVHAKLKSYEESELHLNVFDEFEVDFVIDSSKNLNWIIDSNQWAKKAGINVINLLIYKSALSHSYSHFKRGQNAMYFRKEYLYYKKYFETKLPFISVHYDQLVENPNNVLRCLCKAIEMPFFKRKNKFWEKKHHYFFGSGGVSRLLRSKNPSIRGNEAFSDDFKSLIPTMNENISNDTFLQSMINILESNNVFNKNQQFKMEDSKLRFPLAYHYRRLIQWYKKFRLEKNIT